MSGGRFESYDRVWAGIYEKRNVLFVAELNYGEQKFIKRYR